MLSTSRSRDSFWDGLAVSGEADRSMAGDNAWSDKDCGKTLEGWHIGVVVCSTELQTKIHYEL